MGVVACQRDQAEARQVSESDGGRRRSELVGGRGEGGGGRPPSFLSSEASIGGQPLSGGGGRSEDEAAAERSSSCFLLPSLARSQPLPLPSSRDWRSGEVATLSPLPSPFIDRHPGSLEYHVGAEPGRRRRRHGDGGSLFGVTRGAPGDAAPPLRQSAEHRRSQRRGINGRGGPPAKRDDSSGFAGLFVRGGAQSPVLAARRAASLPGGARSSRGIHGPVYRFHRYFGFSGRRGFPHVIAVVLVRPEDLPVRAPTMPGATAHAPRPAAVVRAFVGEAGSRAASVFSDDSAVPTNGGRTCKRGRANGGTDK